MAKIRFVAKLTRINSAGSKGVCIPKAIAELLELGERYVFVIEETEQGFKI